MQDYEVHEGDSDHVPNEPTAVKSIFTELRDAAHLLATSKETQTPAAPAGPEDAMMLRAVESSASNAPDAPTASAEPAAVPEEESAGPAPEDGTPTADVGSPKRGHRVPAPLLDRSPKKPTDPFYDATAAAGPKAWETYVTADDADDSNEGEELRNLPRALQQALMLCCRKLSGFVKSNLTNPKNA